MTEGRTYALPENQILEEAPPWWMQQPLGQNIVAIEDDENLGSVEMRLNRPERGRHIATAPFLADPVDQGRAWAACWAKRSSAPSPNRSTTRRKASSACTFYISA